MNREESLFYFNRREALGDIDDFIKTDFDLNRGTPKYKIFLFYKKFLREHRDDENRTLLEHINLKRLNFVYRYFIGENRDRYYIETLKKMDSSSGERYILILRLKELGFLKGRGKEGFQGKGHL